MSETVDCAVIGAGVVGLAIARELALAGREVIVLEAEGSIGTHTSSRNSEVIHAGIYYAKGSLKARLCVEGRQMLYAYCAERGIAHRRIGKIVVATEASEVDAVRSYVAKAEGNGVTDLRWLAVDELREMEPEVRCVAGFLSPSTGIVDSHALMLALLGDATNRGASDRLPQSRRIGRAARRKDPAPRRRRRADDARLRVRRELGRVVRPGRGPLDRGLSERARAAPALRQGPLLHARGQVAFSPPRLSGGDATGSSACT